MIKTSGPLDNAPLFICFVIYSHWSSVWLPNRIKNKGDTDIIWELFSLLTGRVYGYQIE